METFLLVIPAPKDGGAGIGTIVLQDGTKMEIPVETYLRESGEVAAYIHTEEGVSVGSSSLYAKLLMASKEAKRKRQSSVRPKRNGRTTGKNKKSCYGRTSTGEARFGGFDVLSEKDVENVRALKEDGLSYYEISKRAGISWEHMYYLMKKGAYV